MAKSVLIMPVKSNSAKRCQFIIQKGTFGTIDRFDGSTNSPGIERGDHFAVEQMIRPLQRVHEHCVVIDS